MPEFAAFRFQNRVTWWLPVNRKTLDLKKMRLLLFGTSTVWKFYTELSTTNNASKLLAFHVMNSCSFQLVVLPTAATLLSGTCLKARVKHSNLQVINLSKIALIWHFSTKIQASLWLLIIMLWRYGHLIIRPRSWHILIVLWATLRDRSTAFL